MAQDDIKLNIGANNNTAALPAGLDNVDDNDPFSDVKKEMRTRFELLPEDVKSVILSSDYEMKLFNMAKAHKLTYEELGTLELETTMMLLGMTRASEFRDELQIELKKNDDEIESLVKDLNDQIFTTIRQSLDRMETARKEEGDYMEPVPNGSVVAAPYKEPSPAVVLSEKAPSARINLESETSISKDEHSVLASSGIEISPTAPHVEKQPMTAPTLNDREKVRSELLKDIQHSSGLSVDVTKTPSPSIIADKLSQAGPIIPSKTTDYSIPKAPPIVPPAPPKSSDPYREPLD